MPNLRDWLSLALALMLGVLVALLIAQVLMSPPRRDLLILAGYLAGSGLGTVVVGALAMRAIDRAAGVSIRAKSAFAALTGTAVALLNVLIVARLMFVSTSHDLRLLVALTVFGAIVPTLVLMFVVFPLRGQPVGAGFAPNLILTFVLVHALWGLGTAVILGVLTGWRNQPT